MAENATRQWCWPCSARGGPTSSSARRDTITVCCPPRLPVRHRLAPARAGSGSRVRGHAGNVGGRARLAIHSRTSSRSRCSAGSAAVFQDSVRADPASGMRRNRAERRGRLSRNCGEAVRDDERFGRRGGAVGHGAVATLVAQGTAALPRLALLPRDRSLFVPAFLFEPCAFVFARAFRGGERLGRPLAFDSDLRLDLAALFVADPVGRGLGREAARLFFLEVYGGGGQLALDATAFFAAYPFDRLFRLAAAQFLVARPLGGEPGLVLERLDLATRARSAAAAASMARRARSSSRARSAAAAASPARRFRSSSRACCAASAASVAARARSSSRVRAAAHGRFRLEASVSSSRERAAAAAASSVSSVPRLPHGARRGGRGGGIDVSLLSSLVRSADSASFRRGRVRRRRRPLRRRAPVLLRGPWLR